jgi:pimeloyl-ACP methyl ester carboxylesterase
VPTLIATGDHDPNLISSRRALVALADARLEVLPLTAHGSVMQRPELVAETVLGFLDG